MLSWAVLASSLGLVLCWASTIIREQDPGPGPSLSQELGLHLPRTPLAPKDTTGPSVTLQLPSWASQGKACPHLGLCWTLRVPSPRGSWFCAKASRQPLRCSQCFQSSGPAGHAFLWVHVVDGGSTRDLETPVPGDREAAHPSLWLQPEAPAPAPDRGSHGLLGSRLDSGHRSPDTAVPFATAPPAITVGLFPLVL